MRFVPVLAVVVMALALYVSRGVLDQVEIGEGYVRVALFPPWQALLGFIAVGAVGLLWLERRTVPRGTATAVRMPLGPLVLPTLALSVLLLPYIPVLPDVFPALQVLAGPLRLIVWVVVLAQLAWTLWQARLLRADWLQRLNLAQLALLVAVATGVLTGGAAARLTGSVLYPGGDEPHYLVIAQSLWRDGDLKIENNHVRGDYHEYYRPQLDPHYLTRGSDGEIYSIHPVGMPVLITPIYALGGYYAAVASFVLLAAFAAALIWHTTVTLTNAAGAATFAWAAVVATAPFLFNAFAIYPEIPAAVAVAIAFTLMGASDRASLTRWTGVGLACAALPWFSTKYAPMSAALVMLAMTRILWPGAVTLGGAATAWRAPGLVRSSIAVLAPYAISLALWFYFFYAFWGVPLPQAPYGALVQTNIRYVIFGGPGLLFDQEYGLLPYAPVYVLALTGLVVMFRSDGEARRRAIEIILTFAALLGTVGAFRIWWGGSASPGRPITSGLLLLMIPIAYAFRAAPVASAQRAAQHLLLWFSIGIAGALLFAQQGLLLANGRDGTSTLLEYLSPRWPAWTVAPSFILQEAPVALAHAGVWLALAGSAAVLLTRLRHTRPGAASLTAMAVTATALLVATMVMPQLPQSRPWPELDARARARLPILDEYDAAARPIGIAYSPLRRVTPAEVVTHSSVVVEPALRTQPQPIRVLHNGRFSLPAGTYRVEIEWGGSRQGEEIGLQIGRTGDPLQRWLVNARPGEVWTHEFSVPVDLPFVGLRGTPEIENVIERVRFVPISVVNATERPRGPAVIAASQSGPATLFYYDTTVSPEESGFWVWGGGQRTRVTVWRPGSREPLMLRVHSGPVPNRLDIRKFGWQQSVDLPPHAPDLIEVPVDAGDEMITLEFAAERAFVPRNLDSTATDARPLGVWVEVVK